MAVSVHNGVIVNAPLNDPNDYIIVWDKQNPGAKVSLPSIKYFNPKIHSREDNSSSAAVPALPTQQLKKGMPIAAKVELKSNEVMSNSMNEAATEVAAPVEVAIKSAESELNSKERFELLKAQKAWLKPDLKAEYTRLKEIHG